jgi:hypothetical protein
MLSLFPGILFLAPLSAFFIRIALAIVFLLATKRHWPRLERKFHILAVIEFATAVSVGVGAWTQAGAIAGLATALFWIAQPSMRPISRIATFLSIVLCLSLIITGAGPFAFDLPL